MHTKPSLNCMLRSHSAMVCRPNARIFTAMLAIAACFEKHIMFEFMDLHDIFWHLAITQCLTRVFFQVSCTTSIDEMVASACLQGGACVVRIMCHVIQIVFICLCNMFITPACFGVRASDSVGLTTRLLLDGSFWTWFVLSGHSECSGRFMLFAV